MQRAKLEKPRRLMRRMDCSPRCQVWSSSSASTSLNGEKLKACSSYFMSTIRTSGSVAAPYRFVRVKRWYFPVFAA